MKPIETGVSRSSVGGSDAARLRAVVETDDTLEAICPYSFGLPLAPLAAAQAEQRDIDPAKIRQVYRVLSQGYECMVVEGAGGVYVPLARNNDVIDLIARLRLPVVVVGRSVLGGINHALLTLDALRRRRIRILALVLNRTEPARSALARTQERTTVDLLRRRAGVPVLGPLPYEPGLAGRFRSSVLKSARSAAITKLAGLVRAAAR